MLALATASASSVCTPRSPGELYTTRFASASTNYDRHTRPMAASWLAENRSNGSFPASDQVFLQLQVFEVTDVNPRMQTFKVQVFIRQMWYDWRLSYANFSSGGCVAGPPDAPEGEFSFDETLLPELWTPGVMVANSADEEIKPNKAFWIYPSGFVWFSTKVLLTLSCTMDFTDMPFDTQHCPLDITALRDSSGRVSMDFYKDTPAHINPGDRGVSDWDLDGVSGAALDPRATGAYSGGTGLRWTFVLKRKPTWYVRYVIMPVVIVVVVSWSASRRCHATCHTRRSPAPAPNQPPGHMPPAAAGPCKPTAHLSAPGTRRTSFFIARDAVPARTGMTVLAYLVLVGITTSILNEVPRVEGKIWLAEFIVASSWFVLFAVLEYAAVNLLYRASARLVIAQAKRKSLIDRFERDGFAEEAPRKRLEKIEQSRGKWVISVPPLSNECGTAASVSPAEQRAAVQGPAGRALSRASREELNAAAIEAEFNKELGTLGRLLVYRCGMPLRDKYRQEQLLIRAETVDYLSRICFPIAYLVFLLVTASSRGS